MNTYGNKHQGPAGHLWCQLWGLPGRHPACGEPGLGIFYWSLVMEGGEGELRGANKPLLVDLHTLHHTWILVEIIYG